MSVVGLLSLMKLFSSRKRDNAMWNLISQLDKYITQVQSGSTLSVDVLDFWRVNGLLGLPVLLRLAKVLCSHPASQPCVKHVFQLVAC